MKKILFAVFIVLIAVGGFFLFKITEVELNQNNCLEASDIDYRSKNIFLVSENKIKGDIQQKYSCASLINVKKIYPNKLKIEVQSQPIAAQIANSQLFVTVDGLITESNLSNLPQLFLPKEQNARIGEKIKDKTSQSAIKISYLLQKSDFYVTNIRILSASEIAVYDTKETVVIFAPEKSADLQVDSLQQVLSKAKIGNEKIAKIDLRFKKPVITYK